MNRPLNKEILRLAVPSILANLTVPLVGMVDTAVAGHLTGGEAAAFIGGISVGAMFFSLLYWGFGFLRTGTGGLTAQAFGRKSPHDAAKILYRGVGLALIIAAGLLVIQWPFVKLALLLVDATAEVERLAAEYFFIRVWAAPATLSLMAFSGWFVGMQDTMSSMWKDFVVNGVNIAASIILSMGIGDWEGIGFAGIALGTVIAQYSGLAFCVVVCLTKYREKVFCFYRLSEVRGIFRGDDMKRFFRMNVDLLGRSAGFIAIYIGYTMIAAQFGDMMLACSAIMMQLLMIFSYFTDGFAYAGEALVGKYTGARNNEGIHDSIRLIFLWGVRLVVLFTVVYAVGARPFVSLLTDQEEVRLLAADYYGWVLLVPVAGVSAFLWDGIMVGATAIKPMVAATMTACVTFFVLFFSFHGLLGNHALWLAFIVYLAVRGIVQTLMRKQVEVS